MTDITRLVEMTMTWQKRPEMLRWPVVDVFFPGCGADAADCRVHLDRRRPQRPRGAMSQGQYLWFARRSLVMHGVPRCLSLRLGELSLLATLVLTCTASPILAEATRGGTLKFVTANDLKVLDPFWTTAYIARNHGYMIYDVLFALDDNLTVQPQMGDLSTGGHWRPKVLATLWRFFYVWQSLGNGRRLRPCDAPEFTKG
jgi:hypothetical protein